MLLPDGRNVDVCTPHGAAAFIEAPGSFEFFTQNIESVDKIREKAKRKGGKLSAKDKRTLEITYLTAEGLGEEAEPEVFAKIPKADSQGGDRMFHGSCHRTDCKLHGRSQVGADRCSFYARSNVHPPMHVHVHARRPYSFGL